MLFDAARALELLRLGTGVPDAVFRPDQPEAIAHVVNGAGRLLVVQRTGWGKSFVYFIATKLLRERGMGPTLLVSPLLALMRNQIAAAERMGVVAATINSANQEEWREVETQLRDDAVDILLISPERLANERFQTEALAEIAPRVALLVIDEAHCISDWGHDFRPHYRMIERIVATMPPNLRLLATTATANDRVLADLEGILGPGLAVSRGDLARPSLFLQTIDLPGQAARFAWLAEMLPKLPGNGIVYTLTVRDANRVAAWLKGRGLAVEAYTGDTGDVRPQLEEALLGNEVKALVATTALGMGFDKPDLAFVIHFQRPGSVVAYYQQVGRAGRALDAAYGVLLSGSEDHEIVDYFIRAAFPTEEEVAEVLGALESAPDGLTIREIEAKANVSNSRIQKTVQLLSLESPAPLAMQDRKWQLTAAELSDAFWSRTRRLTELRREEQAQMTEYASLDAGHMEFLIRALDGDAGGFVPPDLPLLPSTVDAALVRDAEVFLRGRSLPFEPRKQWPTGKRIEAEHLAEAGMALCAWGDGGWGRLVRRGKYADGRFADEFVHACVAMLHQWRPAPAPQWVVPIPSRRHPDLVPDFADRLAQALGLPFRHALVKKADRPEQKNMNNSDAQARNVIGSLGVDRGAMLTGPVLLVDDMVDSRWTFTIAARLLRERGSGQVWPLALADTSAR